MKKCSKCDLEKDLDAFVKGKSSCKECRNRLLREKSARNRKPKQSKEERLVKIRQWTANNPDNRINAIRKYHNTHKLEERQYKILNKDEISVKGKEYRLKNKQKISDRLKVRRRRPVNKLRNNVSSLIRFHIHKNCESISKYLPYTIQELRRHLESLFEPWMNWSNWGKYNLDKWNDNDQTTWTWQIDHIIPQSSLPYQSMIDDNFVKCWAIQNLRPYSAKQNILDGVSRIRHITQERKDHAN